MAYRYKNDMSNNYNELMPEVDSFNTVPTANITPIQDFGFSDPNWDWGGNAGGLPNAPVTNPAIPGGMTHNQTMMGMKPANWNIIGDSLQDGFQMGDMGQWGKNLFGAAKDTVANSATVQTGQELWGGLDNAGKFGTIFSGLETLGGLYKGFKGMQMAKDQMSMQKDMWNKSWEANKKQFNESVSSRAQGRHNGYNDQQKRDEYTKKYSI